MKSADIRQQFIDFFKSKGHTVVPSSPLVPANDPTLLFTNSGMVQFKDVFLGTEKRNYVRATSVQRCLRAGGKHNDLENVGYTARHHTFFEMLGNWSFGDYFKRDALIWAWELLTTTYGLSADKLWATVYETDDEAYDIWVNVIGVPEERVVRIGDNKGAPYASDNFWQMAETGPCGPCSEIFYDHGPEVSGGPPGSPDAEGDRYIEIWNIVFMQFDRQLDAQTGIATLTPLPKPCVDTGMGLERLAAVLQHVHSNYEIDLFRALIKAAARETGVKDLTFPSLKVIADHIRACAFLIVDGVIPDNEGRGYVLRRIARRAMRHGNKLGQKQPFFYRLVDDLAQEMGDAYPELREAKGRVTATLRQEEERFGETLEKGMRELDRAVSIKNFALSWLEPARGWIRKGGETTVVFGNTSYSYDAEFSVNGEDVPVRVISTKDFDSSAADQLDGLVKWLTTNPFREFKRMVLLMIASEESKETPPQVRSMVTASSFPIELVTVDENALKPFRKLRGEVAFKLYDTYGFPIDLIADIGRERDFEIDLPGFEAAMAAQQERSRAASKFTVKGQLDYSGAATVFGGYETLRSEARVLALYREGVVVPLLKARESGVVVLDRTPFYAESGGQVGDRGTLRIGKAVFEVSDTQKIPGDVFGHHGKLAEGTLEIGQTVIAEVDAEVRARTMRHHSVTHLMHKALRQVLGHHVQQKGSLVDPDKTRFDFSHNAPMTAEEILEVEELVNAEILANAATQARVMKFDDAVKHGAMALFGEKYGDEVRVLDIGSSRELCGGTHVARTGDIGLFKIVSEGGVAAGVRRVEAIAGSVALHYVQTLDRRLYAAAELLKVHPAEIDGRIAQMLDNVRALEKELARLKSKVAASQGDDLVEQAVDVKGIKVLAAKLDGADAQALRETMDKLKDKLKSAVILLSAVSDGKVALVAGVTADLTSKIKAGELVNFVAQQVGGKGGGRPDMAQAGGTNPAGLPQALAGVKEWVGAKL